MNTQYTYIHDRPVIYRGDTLPPMAVRLEHEDGVAVIDLIGSEIR